MFLLFGLEIIIRVSGVQVPVPLPNFQYNQLLNFSVDAHCA